MRYAYFPGCSLEVTNKSYDVSTRALCKALGIELVEIPDWNCCGATSYMSVREMLSHVVAARNLAIAEKEGFDTIAVVCPACYTVLNKVDTYMEDNKQFRRDVETALAEIGMTYSTGVEVRHLLDILINDYSVSMYHGKVTTPFDGLKVAPYYGCQLSRPYGRFDNPEWPTSMDDLLEAAGCQVATFRARAKCCGGMQMTTNADKCLDLVGGLLKDAKRNEADIIVTCCPLCQANLEFYQKKVSNHMGEDLSIPVLYFTQVLGLAVGLSPEDVSIGKELVPFAATPTGGVA
jgi:heterodisulfide reductase subunit B